MYWEKLGKIFEPDGKIEWMHSHAANTVAEHLYDDVFRVYFSCRNINNVSNIGFVEVDISPPFKVFRISEKPVLSPGVIGTFDDSGTSLSCIININGKKYLYYVGWNLGVTVPWRNSIGLAIYNETTGEFEKVSKAPIMDRCDVDPFSLSYPFVLQDGHVFRMWYGSNLSWGKEQKDMAHVIKYAESSDGINWKREGIIVINFKDTTEYAISRPHVLKQNNIFKMWYSWRGESYRIGYAESHDGLNWIRKDEEVGIDISESGWDSEMICYPFIFDRKGKRYMIYNGNGYGKTGFGLAVIVNE